MEVSDNIKSNQSLDYLTLQIMNSFLKVRERTSRRFL